MLKDLSEYDQFKKQADGKVLVSGASNQKLRPQVKPSFKERREQIKQQAQSVEKVPVDTLGQINNPEESRQDTQNNPKTVTTLRSPRTDAIFVEHDETVNESMLQIVNILDGQVPKDAGALTDNSFQDLKLKQGYVSAQQSLRKGPQPTPCQP